MMLMPANASNPVVHYIAGAAPGKIGWLIGPSSLPKTKHRNWMPYALDNDAYSSFSKRKDWDEISWINMLKTVSRFNNPPLWVLVPDVVGSREHTIEKWVKYQATVSDFGFRKAFAVQDGMFVEDVPNEAELIFVGGTTKWKWDTVRMWTKNFERVHVGRVNSIERLMICEEIGVESVDGTGWFRDSTSGKRADSIIDWALGKHNGQKQMKIDFTN